MSFLLGSLFFLIRSVFGIYRLLWQKECQDRGPMRHLGAAELLV
jgi:hypothetical protein